MIRSITSIPIKDILSKLEIYPVYSSGRKLYYSSPDNNDAGKVGIIVDTSRNRWIDINARSNYGTNYELVSYLKSIDVEACKEWILSAFPACYSADSDFADIEEFHSEAKYTRITRNEPIASKRFFKFLQYEQLSINVASKYCREISYCSSARGTTGRGIGLENISGGFGVINRRGAINAGPPDIAIVYANHPINNDCFLFVGLRDFLTYVTIYGELENDTIVLFSSAYSSHISPHIYCYSEVIFFAPNTYAKSEVSSHLRSLGIKFKDYSFLYPDSKNLYTMHGEKYSQRQN